LHVLNIFFKHRSRIDGEEFHKTERVFYSKQSDPQKSPPYFTHLYHIEIFKEIIGPYFSEFWEAKSQKNKWQRDQIQRHRSPTDPIKIVLDILMNLNKPL